MNRDVPVFGLVVLALITGVAFAAAPAPVSRPRAVTTTERVEAICLTPNANGTWRAEARVSVVPDTNAPAYQEEWILPVPAGLATALDTLAVKALDEAKKKRP